MNFKNFKVTMRLETPAILGRITTIDSILLSQYYTLKKNQGVELPLDPEHKSVEFIKRKSGVFSGSIWYIPREAKILNDFTSFTMKPEYNKIYKNSNKNNFANQVSYYKSIIKNEETILTKEIYFYITADENSVRFLLKNLKAIGKKQNIGYGRLKTSRQADGTYTADITLEETKNEFGFQMSTQTPTKPLPVVDFNINSKKIAFYRRMTPYWLDENQEACYMPTSSLYEKEDNSASNKSFVTSDISYITNVDFLYEKAKNLPKKTKDLYEIEIKECESPKKNKNNTVVTKDNTEHKCTITNQIQSTGWTNNIRDYFFEKVTSFAGMNYLKNNDFISEQALWAIKNLKEIGYTYVTNKNWEYLRTDKAKDGRILNDFIKKPTMFKPPFSCNIKTTSNAQHVSFKGKVAISNAYLVIQLGDDTLHIDTELLIDAIKDIEKLSKEHKSVTRNFLCGNMDKAYHQNNKENISDEIKEIANDFMLKYDINIRTILSGVKLD